MPILFEFSKHVIISCVFFRCDVSNEDDWSILWEHAETFFADKVSILVNNAGVGAGAGWKASINVMLLGVGFGTFQAIEKMGISKVWVRLDQFCCDISSLAV